MDKELFNYHLPAELIAQAPSSQRQNSHLMVINRKLDTIEHKYFYDIINYLPNKGVIVLNNTKVVSARLYATKKSTGAKIELLYLSHQKNIITTLTKHARKIHVGDILNINNELILECIKIEPDGILTYKANYSDSDLIAIIQKYGQIPLPPYIKATIQDENRYQTVYAKELGSSAAPTAGLHFTDELLLKIKNKGLKIVYITLKIGLDTFRPIKEDNILLHQMHTEEYLITKEAADILNNAISNKEEIIAVGTTSVRTLESNFNQFNKITAGSYKTNLFIYPGYKFRVVSHLITNFHLPMSSLVLLVSSFYEREKILNAYQEAINKKYHFFSFGDAMYLI